MACGFIYIFLRKRFYGTFSLKTSINADVLILKFLHIELIYKHPIIFIMTIYSFIQNELRLMEMQFPVVALPPGTRLSDFFMDGQEVMQELKISARTLQHYRTTGKLSYTNQFGKLFYFKQEIARLLMESRQQRKRQRDC